MQGRKASNMQEEKHAVPENSLIIIVEEKKIPQIRLQARFKFRQGGRHDCTGREIIPNSDNPVREEALSYIR